ncbi:C40 family peptidase [Alicyclobacillus sp.]|uniref:C40 family peptidase n=1 Tax=Alicyclobacillus sp. TaxID=61169 RepID=UPI0025B92D6F|nr:C40 family peptidase [Alicyclobacillus sp.]MCL6516662.1 C40 family peptidase [Alicyclobacillus sp.]
MHITWRAAVGVAVCAAGLTVFAGTGEAKVAASGNAASAGVGFGAAVLTGNGIGSGIRPALEWPDGLTAANTVAAVAPPFQSVRGMAFREGVLATADIVDTLASVPLGLAGVDAGPEQVWAAEVQRDRAAYIATGAASRSGSWQGKSSGDGASGSAAAVDATKSGAAAGEAVQRARSGAKSGGNAGTANAAAGGKPAGGQATHGQSAGGRPAGQGNRPGASAGSASLSSRAGDPAADATLGARIALTAESYLGVPYRWGGTSERGFDCSGLVQYTLARVGIHVGRTSYDQYQSGRVVSRANLEPGDLVFFDTDGPGASHVGIYVGGGRFVNATSSGVRTDSLSSGYWASHYLGARRVHP